MAQNELFRPDDILKLTPEDTANARERFKATGRQQGDAISDRFMETAAHIIRVKLRAMDVDIEAEARSEGMDVDEYIEEMDAYYELVNDFARAYLEGIDLTFPFPVLDT